MLQRASTTASPFSTASNRTMSIVMRSAGSTIDDVKGQRAAKRRSRSLPRVSAPTRIVKFFATVNDKSADPQTQVLLQSATFSTIDVGSGGAKLSLSAVEPSDLTLLVPGHHRRVTFNPTKLKTNVLTILVKRKDHESIDCSLETKPDSPKK
jgi:hypothetical protein